MALKKIFFVRGELSCYGRPMYECRSRKLVNFLVMWFMSSFSLKCTVAYQCWGWWAICVSDLECTSMNVTDMQ